MILSLAACQPRLGPAPIAPRAKAAVCSVAEPAPQSALVSGSADHTNARAALVTAITAHRPRAAAAARGRAASLAGNASSTILAAGGAACLAAAYPPARRAREAALAYGTARLALAFARRDTDPRRLVRIDEAAVHAASAVREGWGAARLTALGAAMAAVSGGTVVELTAAAAHRRLGRNGAAPPPVARHGRRGAAAMEREGVGSTGEQPAATGRAATSADHLSSPEDASATSHAARPSPSNPAAVTATGPAAAEAAERRHLAALSCGAALLSFLLAAGSALACVEACFVVSLAFAQRARLLLLAALVRLAALGQDEGTSTESDMRP